MSILPPLYHGTISTFVPDILKRGLAFTPSNQWRITIPVSGRKYRPIVDDEPGFVYLSVKKIAEAYAIAKAAYYRAKPCQDVINDTIADIVKDCDAPVILDAKPVILRVDANQLSKYQFERDPHSEFGLRYHGSIDPQYIEVVKWQA